MKNDGKMVVAVKNADIKTYRERSLYIGTKKGMKGALKVVKKGLEKVIEKQTTEHPALADSEERGWHNRCITIYSTDNGILIKPELIKKDIGTTIKDVEYTLSMQVGEVLTGFIFEETDVVSEGDEYPELSKKVEEITDARKSLEEDRLTPETELGESSSLGSTVLEHMASHNSVRDHMFKYEPSKEFSELLAKYAHVNQLDKDDPTGEIYGDAYETQRLQEDAEDEAYAVRFIKGPFHSADIRYSNIEFTPGYFWHDAAANLPIDRTPVLLNESELISRVITNACEYYDSDEVTRQSLLRIIQNDYGIVPVSYIINIADHFTTSNHPLVKPENDEDLPSMNDIYEIEDMANKYEDVIRKSLAHPGKYAKNSNKWNWNFLSHTDDMTEVEWEFVMMLDYVLISMVSGSKRCVPTVVDCIYRKSLDSDTCTEVINPLEAISKCTSVFDMFNTQYSASNVMCDQYNIDCRGYREVYQMASPLPLKLRDIPAGYYFVTVAEGKKYLRALEDDHAESYGVSLPIYYTKYNGKMIGGGYKSPYHIYSPSKTMMDYYETDVSLSDSTPVKKSINELLSSKDKELRELGKAALNDLKDTECYLLARSAFVVDAGGDDNE